MLNDECFCSEIGNMLREDMVDEDISEIVKLPDFNLIEAGDIYNINSKNSEMTVLLYICLKFRSLYSVYVKK